MGFYSLEIRFSKYLWLNDSRIALTWLSSPVLEFSSSSFPANSDSADFSFSCREVTSSRNFVNSSSLWTTSSPSSTLYRFIRLSSDFNYNEEEARWTIIETIHTVSWIMLRITRIADTNWQVLYLTCSSATISLSDDTLLSFCSFLHPSHSSSKD